MVLYIRTVRRKVAALGLNDRKLTMSVAVGRPPIGPKVQTHIPPEEFRWIVEEAKRHGVRPSEVLRRVICDSVRAKVKQ